MKISIPIPQENSRQLARRLGYAEFIPPPSRIPCVLAERMKGKFKSFSQSSIPREKVGGFIEPHGGQTSYTRRLSGNFYPRFHLYLEEKEGQLIFNLHLDQKQPSYQGSHAHSGEYDGELVEQEGERIKSYVSNF